MYKKYNVYKFAANELYTSLNYLKACEDELIEFHQSKINILKKDKNGGLDKAYAYLDKISVLSELLKENHNLYDIINQSIQQLEENINIMEYSEIHPEFSLEDRKKEDNTEISFEEMIAKANKINEVGKTYYRKLLDLSYEAKELLNSISSHVVINNNSIFEDECKHLYHLPTDLEELFGSININESSNQKFIETVEGIVSEEEDRIDYISSEAYKVICLGEDEAINSGALDMFCSLVRNEYSKIMDRLNEIDSLAMEIHVDETSNIERTAIESLQEIVDIEGRKVRSSLIKLEKQVDRTVLAPKDNKHLSIIDKAIEEDDDPYIKKIKQLINTAKDNPTVDNKDLYNKLVKIIEPEKYEATLSLPAVYPESEKENDTKEYRKNIDIQNKSFWEARSIAYNEGVKYPSVEYERKVREYQNEWLLEKYNISLEELYDKIEEYEEKYAEDIYIKKIYNSALKRLREESSLSISELCDESYGLSLLDKKAYELLENDLTDTIKIINQTKRTEEISTSVAVADYRKNIKLNKLIDRKEMIDREMYLLRKRAERLEKESE